MCYATSAVDISPFDDVEGHQTMKKAVDSNALLEAGEGEEEDYRRKKIAKLRFTGTLEEAAEDVEGDEGAYHDKLFEGVGYKKRKINELEKGEFSSITPVQNVEFEIKDTFKDEKMGILLKLSGNDVFGGLFELCDSGVIDPENIPGFLTGEEGLNGGVIDEGMYVGKVDKFEGGALI